MVEFEDGMDPYAVLGIQGGPELTDHEIRKAYRKMALEKHPDKNKDNPKAAEEFSRIGKAYEVLSDKDARAALDAVILAKRKRQEELSRQGAKRRRMREDLEAREAALGAGPRARAKNEEEMARDRFRAELERLNRQAAERRRAAMGAAAAERARAAGPVPGAAGPTASAPGSGRASPAPAAQTAELREQLARTVRASWRVPAEGPGYTVADLREVFGRHGVVQDVILRDSGKKRKGVALVTLDSPAAVQRAVATVNGSLDNPILTMPASRGASNAEAEAGGGRREGSRAEVGPDAADGGVGSTAAGPMDGGVGVGGRGLVTGREPGGVGVSAPSAGMRFPAAGSVPLPPTKPLFAAAASMTRPASGSVSGFSFSFSKATPAASGSASRDDGEGPSSKAEVAGAGAGAGAGAEAGAGAGAQAAVAAREAERARERERVLRAMMAEEEGAGHGDDDRGAAREVAVGEEGNP